MEVPSNFKTVIADFANDLSVTFSEYSYLWSKWAEPDISDSEINHLFEYCIKVYPERFFDILYQNEDMFKPDSEINTYFLPNVSFRFLMNCEDVSENTKKTIWKYLQLMLFTIVGGIKDKSTFGESMNVFEGIDEGELQGKLEESMAGLSDFFSKMGQEQTEDAAEPNAQDPAPENMEEQFKNMFGKMPNMDNIKDHLKGLFDGKIGKLAKELAEEISGEFSDIISEDMKDVRSTQDVIKKLMKDPKKIVDLMKKVGSKLDNKMKSGDVSREELMKEASELLGRMKDAGGQDQFNEMFKNLAKNMGGLGKNMKLDTNALDRMTKQASMREKMKAKVEQKKQKNLDELNAQIEEAKKRLEEQKKLSAAYSLQNTNVPNNFVFRLDGEDTQEKSFVHPDLLKEFEEQDKKSSEKTTQNKKKKNKNKK
jgi:hypothetical protein